MVQYKTGNLLEVDADCIICHQVNCRGAMNSGIAKAIRQKWPKVYKEYMAKTTDVMVIGQGSEEHSLLHMFGLIQPVYVPEENRMIINMFAQEGYGYDGRRYTSYDAFWSCLGEIKKYITPGAKIGFPYRIGCGLGGANWQVIETMIYEVLGKDYDVYIYVLEEN